MGDPVSSRVTLRNKFELEKRHRPYAGVHPKVVKSPPNMKLAPSNDSRKQKAMEMEEIVRHMKDLPGYLERGRPIQDRALNFGVMDWGRLEKWQYQHHKQGVIRSSKYSPSSSNSSSLFSTDGSSPRSSSGPSCSPAHQKVHRVTLLSHFNTSPKEDVTPRVGLCSQISDKFQCYKDAPTQLEIKPRVPRIPESKSSSLPDEPVNELGNVQDPPCRTCNPDDPEKHKTIVLSPRNGPRSNQANGINNPKTYTFQSEVVNSHMELDSARNQSHQPRNETPERKRSTGSSKNSDPTMGNSGVTKQRSISPLRRFSFSFSMTSKSAAPTSSMKRVESLPVSQNSTKDGSRSQSSPLRRLLDPIFPSKARQFAEMRHQHSKTKAKVKLDLRNTKEIGVDDASSSRKLALFQTAIKNGRILFTFAVENDNDVLAATVTSLSSSGKDDGSNWIYMFFTIHETKKKNRGWLSQGSKSNDHGYVPNVTAQMKVSNRSTSHHDTREFVLFSVDPNVQPQDELEAIVVKFSRKANGEHGQEGFSTTVILPGGNHGAPSKGEPSSLTDRWRSGGACDCGGWDMGCRLRTLTNEVQSRSSLANAHTTAGQFELFFQGELSEKKPFFSLSPLKEGIFSVEYNSSLSLLQVFSMCISVIECRKASQHMERNASFLHSTRNATGKVTSS